MKNNKLKSLSVKIIELLMRFVPHKKKSIIILESSYPSGSNSKILYDYLKDSKMKTHYRISYLNTKDGKVNFLKKCFLVARHEIIVSTHGFQKIKKTQQLINLWHGIPLKSMNHMEIRNESFTKYSDDYLITNSKFESVLLSSCMFIPFKKHRILGSPRLEYFKENNVKDLEFISKDYTYIIYLPTFRSGKNYHDEGIFTGNLFNMDVIDYSKLDSFFYDNKIKLLVKYHQNEIEKLNFNFSSYENILDLNDQFLIENRIDLYEVLPHTSLLITDYSSVYIDYLLLDKPIIFTATDLKEYKNSRGLLLEPYREWTPGDIIQEEETLKNSILNNLAQDSYAEERERLKEVFFPEYKNSDALFNISKLIFEITDGNIQKI